PYQEKDLVTCKKMVTKLWNASRFVTMNLEGYKPKRPNKFTEIDKWLLTKINDIVKVSTEHFDRYEYSKTRAETEKFFWKVFCDYYLEIIKDRIYNQKNYEKWEIESVKYTLYYTLLSVLKLSAPIMPYITEDIYQHYFKKFEKHKSIHISEWPKYDTSLSDKKAEKAGDTATDIIASIRKFKSDSALSMAEPLRYVTIDSADVKLVLKDIEKTMKIKKVKIGKAKEIETENFKVKLDVMK
ncbi:MAG: class I tRNA ligase family protein, partial [Candidatus Aenigmarchaeota archaeon]|nr:class I tRNA ligase family protein [Candidatus Aenigmarchaeota archaeon]